MTGEKGKKEPFIRVRLLNAFCWLSSCYLCEAYEFISNRIIRNIIQIRLFISL